MHFLRNRGGGAQLVNLMILHCSFEIIYGCFDLKYKLSRGSVFNTPRCTLERNVIVFSVPLNCTLLPLVVNCICIFICNIFAIYLYSYFAPCSQILPQYVGKSVTKKWFGNDRQTYLRTTYQNCKRPCKIQSFSLYAFTLSQV